VTWLLLLILPSDSASRRIFHTFESWELEFAGSHGDGDVQDAFANYNRILYYEEYSCFPRKRHAGILACGILACDTEPSLSDAEGPLLRTSSVYDTDIIALSSEKIVLL